MSALRERLFPATAALAVVAAGLSARAVLHGPAGKYTGVALWATMVYFLVLLVRPQLRRGRAFWLTVGISFAVELFQLTPLPMRLYQIHPFFALALGTTFNWLDLPSYVAGAAFGALLHRVLR